jgi:transposase
MDHVAIDLGSRESQICVRQPDGTIIKEWKHPTKKLVGVLKLLAPSRVVMETGAEAFRIADEAQAVGHEVRVVPATLVKALGVGDRGIKTDERDARNLSLASCRMEIPSVHIPTEMSRQLKSMCGSREALVEARTKLINNVRGWLRTQLWRIRSGDADSFVDRVRGHAAMQNEELPEHIDRQLVVIATMTVELKAADKQVAKIAKGHPVCTRFMTVPGVGPITAVRFLAAIDDPTRFHSAHAVESYLGLTPGENSSSQRRQRTGITKAGPAALRWSLTQAAWAAMRVRSQQPMIDWTRRIIERRGKRIAIVALARKIAGILFALWRDGTTYRSSLSATPAPST